MNVEAIGKWLTGSIVGIVVLGAMGSILGGILLHLGKPLVRFAVRRLGSKLARAGGRPVVRLLLSVTGFVFRQWLVARWLNRLRDRSFAAGFYVCTDISMQLSMCLFFIFLSGSVVFVGSCRLQHPLLSAFLVAMTVFWFVACVLDSIVHACVGGASPIEREEKRLEKRHLNPDLFA